ncbi:AMMECR1 domain-containing protein, partial [Candidatus Falkowbacteria bacterium CG23_combo_of_CG06-09_8_20_14_all_41_10]
GYKNSGDILGGDKQRVVGYGAIIFSSSDLNSLEQKILRNIAQTSVENYVKSKKILEFEIKGERLKTIQGAFVTLKKNREPRG